MPFEQEVTVRFYEVDRAGIVFFGRVFEYCHVAYEELLREITGDLNARFDVQGWGTPLVHAEADYLKPMNMGDRLRVQLEVERLGRRSVTFAYTLLGQDGAVHARAKLVHVFVNFERFESVDAPADFIAGLRRLELIDEATARELPESAEG